VLEFVALVVLNHLNISSLIMSISIAICTITYKLELSAGSILYQPLPRRGACRGNGCYNIDTNSSIMVPAPQGLVYFEKPVLSP